MELSDKDRKILWARAGDLCSYNHNGEKCDTKLSKTTQMGDTFAVGVECHIIGEKPASARYCEEFKDKETHENRILLCPTHHTIIDRDEGTYTVEVLKNMKRTHEKYMEDVKIAKPSPQIEIRDSNFVMTAKNVKTAVGMEVNQPARLTNVNSQLNVENVETATGFRTNQRLSSIMTICECGRPFSYVCTGPAPSTIVCPNCGKEHRH
jgi:rRNA maturation endonuclease Nob1